MNNNNFNFDELYKDDDVIIFQKIKLIIILKINFNLNV